MDGRWTPPARHRGVRLLVVLCGVLAAGRGPAAQSLGDLARREEARRATIATPSPVYSDSSRPRQDRPLPPALPATSPGPLEALLPAPPGVASPMRPASLQPGVVSVAWDVSAPAAPPPPAAVSPDLAGRSAAPAPAPARAIAPSASGPPQVSSSAPAVTGGSRFQIKKTPEEMAETARLAGASEIAVRTVPADVRLPAAHDTLRLSTGVSYLQGADFGLDVIAAGKVSGMQTAVTSFFTAGPLGLQSRSGRASIFSPNGRWRGEGGDLYSDLGGLARGGRVSYYAGDRWTPSVSLYVPRAFGTSNSTTVIAYRDRYQLLPRVRVGGEVTSEGATFLQGHYAHPGLNLTAFSRHTRGVFAGHDKGISGGLGIGRGVALSGAIRLSDAANDSKTWQLASVRLPLPQQASVALERSWWTGSSEDGSINAVVLQLTAGKVRVMQRLQWGRTDYRQRAIPFGFDRRQSQSLASYTPGPWGSVNYQQSTQWFDDGRAQHWEELSSLFHVSRRTSLQIVSAFPDLWDSRRFRARLQHQLAPTLLLEAQYGRLSAFQLTRASMAEESKVMITLRKTWQVQTPARGADVRGRAIDQAGHPVPGALVRLGPYSAITDAGGAYRFARVPEGDFELALDRNKLPAAYAWDEAPLQLSVGRRSRVHTELHVIPLNAIRGRVYLDRNGNGTYDEGEGVPHVVVRVGNAVTATGATGAYAFYNQPPGRYVVRLDTTRLAKGLAPAAAAERAIDLTGDQPALGVDFVLEERDMPVIIRRVES